MERAVAEGLAARHRSPGAIDGRLAAGRLAPRAATCGAFRRAEARSGLILQDIVPIKLPSYGVQQLQYEREARASGYSELK